MGLVDKILSFVKEKIRFRLRGVKLPAELPRSPRELIGLLQSGVRAMRAPREEAPRAVEPAPPLAKPEPPPPPPAREADPHAPADPPPAPENHDELSIQARVEAAKYELGPTGAAAELADIDALLPDLPEGYGDDRIVLLSRAPHWLYAYWDVTNERKETVRQRGGRQIGLRLHDLTTSTHVDHGCHELARTFFLPAAPAREYEVELGYWTESGELLPLVRSARVTSPPASPSPLVRDVFLTLDYRRAAARGREAAEGARRALAEAQAVLAAERAAAERSREGRAAAAPGGAEGAVTPSPPSSTWPGALPTSPGAGPSSPTSPWS